MSSLEFSRRQFLQKMSLMPQRLRCPLSLFRVKQKQRAQAHPMNGKSQVANGGRCVPKWSMANSLKLNPLNLIKHPTEMIQGIKGILYGESRVRYPMVRLDWLKKS